MEKAAKKMHMIDASGKRLGRVASEAAMLLLGKDSPTFKRHIAANVHVTIENASKLEITDTKMKDTVYTRYTGYPGGLRKVSMEKLAQTKGYEEVLRKAIYGMLPGNKLRNERMKNLTINA